MRVRSKWNGQEYVVYYPEIYKIEAMKYIKDLPFYLERWYGKEMKKELFKRVQSITISKIYDEEENCTMSEKHM